MKTLKITLIAALVATGLYAANGDVVSVKKINSTSSTSEMVVADSSSVNSSNTTILNEKVIGPVVKGKKRYTDNEIQTFTRDQAYPESFKFRETVKQLVFMRDNPVEAALENATLGAINDIQENIDAINKMLGDDRDQRAEKDPVALAKLKQDKAELEKKLASLQKQIPIADTGYMLPEDTVISVMGSSHIQAYPLTYNGQEIGHYRVACSGSLKEDIIINQTSVNYCIASLYINGAPRVSDVAVHVPETVDMYYVGISEPYVAGKDATVKINWQTHPKRSVTGTLKYYNLDKVANVDDTLNFNTAITLSNGTRYAGKNAAIE